MVCRECIGTVLQGHTGGAAGLTCPLCRAKVQTKELVKGVNEGAQTLEEEDSFTASLEEKASSSDSKLMALLEEVMLCPSVCLFSKCLSIRCVCRKQITFVIQLCVYPKPTLARM